MKNRLFFLLSFITGLSCQPQIGYAQNLTEITLRPTWDFRNPAKFKYTREINLYGEEGTYSFTFTIEKIAESGDVVTIQTISGIEQCNNPQLKATVESGLFYALLGLNMKAEIDQQGILIRVLNEQEVIDQVKSHFVSLPEEERNKIINDRVAADRELFFTEIFTVNYSLALSYMNKTISLPTETRKDTIIKATRTKARQVVSSIEEIKMVGDLVQFTKQLNKISDAFSKENGGLLFDVKSDTIQATSTSVFTKDGMLLKMSSQVKQVTGGFTSYRDKKEITTEAPVSNISGNSIELVD